MQPFGFSVAKNLDNFFNQKHKRSFLLIKHQGHDVLTQWANLDQDKVMSSFMWAHMGEQTGEITER